MAEQPPMQPDPRLADLAPRVARTQLTFAGVAVVTGAIGLWISRSAEFAGGPGVSIFEGYELRTMSYNPLAAFITIAIGALGLAGALLRRPILGGFAGGLFALMSLQPLLQWRSGAGNLLGANGRNWGFNLAIAVGLVVPAVVARLAGVAVDPPDRPLA